MRSASRVRAWLTESTPTIQHHVRERYGLEIAANLIHDQQFLHHHATVLRPSIGGAVIRDGL